MGSVMKVICSNNQYDSVLISLLTNLSSMRSKCGSEGVAYFVDDKFVIKEFSFAFIFI